mmetsp:Transcript_23217/g.69541  ORF Transcript_23217/g.69541 Transcript_23217/m.69541 type:complete len:348 (-) Transcript_23217:65-1108(-)
MLVVNKVTLAYLPFPSLVSFVQICASVVLVYAGKWTGLLGRVDALTWKKVAPYLFYVVLFALALLTNMQSLKAATVETVIVFRSMTPLAVSVLDAAYLNRELPSARSWGALLIIAAGATAYAYCDPAFRALGWAAYGWPALYFVVIAIEMTYGKLIVHAVEMESKIWGPVLYTNVLAAPVMAAMLYASDDWANFKRLRASSTGLPPVGLLLLAAGCIVGTGISYAGWLCRSKTSASTYTLVGVLNKCGTVLANAMIWTQHAPPLGMVALGVCLGGGVLYRQAPVRDGPRLLVAQMGDASKKVFKGATAPITMLLCPDDVPDEAKEALVDAEFGETKGEEKATTSLKM